MKSAKQQSIDYERVAAQLVRALRGRRSCAELSRRAGYKSNIVQRWEAGHCWPAASRFLQLHGRIRPTRANWISRFYNMVPVWAENLDATSSDAVALFLQNLRGKTPVLSIAAISGINRFSVSRWLSGTAEPKLPDFLRVVDASSRRLLDLLAALEDPARLPAVREAWEQHKLAERAAYEQPWSHAVLRALELEGQPGDRVAQQQWISERLGIAPEEVLDALRVLEATRQVRSGPGGFRLRHVGALDTSRDPKRAYELKLSWTSTAVDRMRMRDPGHFGYSVFAVSKRDFARLRDLHVKYYRAMQDIIAKSQPNECVGLYCAQLLDLGAGAKKHP